MRILEKTLTARIDRALDDGRPLDGATRWFVLRNEKLRRYYESMLALELELRFPLDDPPSVDFVRKQSKPLRESRRPTLSQTAAAIFLGIAVSLCAWGVYVHQFPRIDLAEVSTPVVAPNSDDLFLWETLASISPLELDVPFPDKIDSPLFSLSLPSTEPICEFSDRPVESTATLLKPLAKLFANRSGNAEQPLEN